MIPIALFPPDIWSRAFIAGGFAACPALASDMDIWVRTLPVDGELMSETKERILAHLEEGMWPYEAIDDPRGQIEAGIAPYGGLGGIWVLKVATIRSPHLSHPYHIMVVNANPAELLETFDISTHQVALVNGNVVLGNGWTSILATPRVLRMTPTTPERFRKICARYGHTFQEGML